MNHKTKMAAKKLMPLLSTLKIICFNGYHIPIVSGLARSHWEYWIHLWELFFKRNIVPRKSAEIMNWLTLFFTEDSKGTMVLSDYISFKDKA